MRIIAGKYKSRRIYYGKESSGKKQLQGNSLYRPTTDRAKESLFNILNNMLDFDSVAALDLFAGSGALGFEAISRGAASCDFVEISFKQLRQIQRTADELAVGEQTNIYQSDVLDFLAGNPVSDYHIIFADPPYDYNKYDSLISSVLHSMQGIFVVEHSADIDLLYDTKRFEVMNKKIGFTQFKIISAK